MDVSGLIRTTCPPDLVLSVLGDSATLLRLLPKGSKLDQIDQGRFRFSVSRAVGPVKLTLPGEMALVPAGQGHDRMLTIRAAHIIGGKVDLDLSLTFDTSAGHTRLAYAGTVEASGLAGRVLRERHARVDDGLRSLFHRLKVLSEAKARKHTAEA
jgi:carbon monoxide dehydrogenase subunit G